MALLTIKVTRESVSFEVSDPNGKLTSEAALAMAEINTRWGYHESIEILEKQHTGIIEKAAKDTVQPEAESQIQAMLKGSNSILILEELAASFRESRDDPEDEGPEFLETDDSMTILQDYAESLGCTVEIL